MAQQACMYKIVVLEYFFTRRNSTETPQRPPGPVTILGARGARLAGPKSRVSVRNFRAPLSLRALRGATQKGRLRYLLPSISIDYSFLERGPHSSGGIFCCADGVRSCDRLRRCNTGLVLDREHTCSSIRSLRLVTHTRETARTEVRLREPRPDPHTPHKPRGRSPRARTHTRDDAKRDGATPVPATDAPRRARPPRGHAKTRLLIRPDGSRSAA